jgi:SEC-C motif domain protein
LSQCPCGNELVFEKCCEPYIEGEKQAATPEILMRARYTAYTISDIDFIEKSYLNHEDDFDYNGTKKWADSSVWHGLTIKDTQKGGAEDDEGFVDFVAYYTDENGKESYHQEKSLFVKEEGKWLFKEGLFEGLAPLKREGNKVGRNDPCPCDSGKKFKKCCGR